MARHTFTFNIEMEIEGNLTQQRLLQFVKKLKPRIIITSPHKRVKINSYKPMINIDELAYPTLRTVEQD